MKVSLLEGIERKNAFWLLLMALMLIILLLPISSYIASLPFIQEEWGLSNTQAGVVYSAYMAGYALSALFIIPLTDRFGSGRILAGSAIVSVLSHILFPLVAHHVATGTILRAIAGVGYVGIYMPGLRVVAERFTGGGRGAAMGLFVSASYAAFSGSLAITGVLITVFDWRDAYLYMALASSAGLPIAYMMLRGHCYELVGTSSGKLALTVLKNPHVRYLILGYSLHAVQIHTIRMWLPLFLIAVQIARGVEIAQAAVIGAMVGGVALAFGIVGPVLGGLISDRWGRVTSASAIFAMSGACACAIGWTGDLPWVLIIAVAVVYGWSTAADSAIYSTGITEVTEPASLGSAMAMQAFMGFMGGVVGPIAFGGILDLAPKSYQWGWAFSSLGLLAVVAISGLLRLRSLSQSRLLAQGKG